MDTNYKKYRKYKIKYLNQKGGQDIRKSNQILLLPFSSINMTKEQKEDNILYFTNLLKNMGEISVYEFKFNNVQNNFTLEDYHFENASEDIKNFIIKYDLEQPIIVCLGHASPYGLYTINKYPDLFSGIICFPFRLYVKASLERRIWKFRDQGGWNKYISKKYDLENYYLNPTNESIQNLLKNPGKEELEVLYHITDRLLQMQADYIPKIFNIPTILFTRLDMDVESIIKLNFERKAIAEMKDHVSESDALYGSMMWNFDRVKFDKNLLDLNKKNDKLRIRYYIAELEDDRNLSDAIIILLNWNILKL